MQSKPGGIVALLEDGECRLGFGYNGKVTLEKAQIVSGAGLSPWMSISSIRELTDGSLLVGATGSNDHIHGDGPATQGMVFRLGSDGALLDPPRPADRLLEQRYGPWRNRQVTDAAWCWR